MVTEGIVVFCVFERMKEGRKEGMKRMRVK